MKTLLTLDFETYYDSHVNLKNLAPAQYIRHSAFFVWGAAITVTQHDDDWAPRAVLLTGEWVLAKDLAVTIWALKKKYPDLVANGHNALFDGLVLNEHFDIKFDYWVDTLAMSRAISPHTSHDLDTMLEMFGLGQKQKGVLEQTKGKRELTEEQLTALGSYAIDDAVGAADLASFLLPIFPEAELDLINLTTQMGVDPVLDIDLDILEPAVEQMVVDRETAISASGVPENVLRSSAKFAKHLQSLGITPPQKISPKTGEPTWAFAKNDLDFIDLQAAHPELDALWEAKRVANSSIKITRAERMLDIGRSGKMPMHLNYYGAHTGRWSGGGKVNVQNLPRNSAHRKCLTAPEGYVVAVADSSQIELRVNAEFCGQTDALQLLAAGQDIYKYTAADVLDIPVESIEKESKERMLGKATELALGYQMGAPKFRLNMAVGFMGCPRTYFDLQEAQLLVHRYRQTKHKIAGMWDTLQNYIPYMAKPGFEEQLGYVTLVTNGIMLPNGMMLNYEGLQATEDGWIYGHNTYLYGGIMLENIIQALARIVVAEQMLEISKFCRIVSMTHDENISILPVSEAEAQYAEMIRIMSTPPSWMPDIPLAADGGYDKRYIK